LIRIDSIDVPVHLKFEGITDITGDIRDDLMEDKI
jgi:hypothetical protein